MRILRHAEKLTNALLGHVGVRLVRSRVKKPWDEEFARWIGEAKAAGVDPNDVGDRAWSGPALENASRNLFPRINPQSIVLELGPGSGRYTRHVLPRCRQMIVVDYSAYVCEWLREYLRGKGQFQVHHIDRPTFSDVADDVVDFAFANGVFEHIDPDDTDFLLQEFHRVLKPGGVLWFNFDNFMSPDGWRWFNQEKVEPGGRRLFRFYHPELLRRMAEMRGFSKVAVTTDEGRLASLEAFKPPVGASVSSSAGLAVR